MRTQVAFILSTFGVVLAIPTQQSVLSGNEIQLLVGGETKLLPVSWPGIDLDLNEQRLVQMEGAESPVWISELDKIIAKAQGKNFFDITEDPDAFTITNSYQAAKAKPFPPPNATDTVADVISRLSTDEPKRNLATFTTFRTRYYRSDTGRDSQKWLLGRIYDITQTSLRDDIDINEFSHSWGQNSIIAKIPGSDPEGTVIISAHQDSINMWPFLPAPGADDDGSGTMTILEAYRALLDAEFQPKNDVEFHWYSAEEGGLLGSQAVAADYKKHNATILAQIQFDMTAFVKKGTREEVGVITDFVDPEVVSFVKKLIDAYLDIPYVETKCGYACSDHASWTQNGYPSSFAIESSFENSNHDIHSTKDIWDQPEFSFEHMLEFSKLAVAFAVELSNYTP